MRKTKIICTIGPASQNEETLRELCRAGMNVARLNFSHGDHAEQLAKIVTLKKLRSELHLPIAIMLDTKGPECRIKSFENGFVDLVDGASFTLTTREVVGNQQMVSVQYNRLNEDLHPGDRVLLCNGLIVLEVEDIQDTDIHCRVIAGGRLGDKKSMNFPGRVLNQDYISPQDRADILMGVENDVDFIAASFVSRKEDVEELRRLLDENGGEDIDIIAKIENRSGVDNIEEICSVADGIMVARGDLGVEIPFVEVPAIQKYLIRKCRLLGKRVITATEMLESMITNSRPTRAEVSDVANAVYDGTSAVMLSGETAGGKYPVQAFQAMARICEYTEEHIHYAERFRTTQFEIHNIQDAISHATCAMAIDVGAKAIVVNSRTGRTARMVSRFRCPVDILGTTTNEKVWHKLNLSWGVTPVLCEEYPSLDVMFWQDIRKAREVFCLQPGDNLVLNGGSSGVNTWAANTIKVETIH